MLLVTDLPIIKNYRPRAMFICAIHTSSPSARLKLARMSRLDRAFVDRYFTWTASRIARLPISGDLQLR